MGNPTDRQDTQSPGHYGNQGKDAARPSGVDRQEQLQRSKDQAPTDQDGRMRNSSQNSDREERIRQRAHELWEQAGRPDGHADQHWERAAQDLDREDAQHEGPAGDTPARPDRT